MAGWWTVGRPSLDRRGDGVDVVHLTLPLFPVPTRRPLVATVHDLFPLQHPDWYSRQDRFAVGRALRSLEGAAEIIAVSQWTAEALVGLPWIDPARVTVVREGVTPRFATTPEPRLVAEACADLRVDEGGFDLFIGQVSARKDVGVLVDAMARQREPGVLVLAGPPGDATESVRSRAEAVGVASRLRWAGFVSDERLNALLHAARALVHPCPDEGFGLTPLEAMAAGTPTVVADAGALRETVGDAALRCPPGDADAWADALDRLWDPALRADLVGRGREQVTGYDWADVARATRAVYERALGADTARSPRTPE
jgi:glycosyltransferase involved in cell wall biosynthesis